MERTDVTLRLEQCDLRCLVRGCGGSEGNARIGESIYIQRNKDSTNEYEYCRARIGGLQQLLAWELSSENWGVCVAIHLFVHEETTPGIEVKGGDGFPTRLWFNSDECAMPDYFPTSRGGALRMGSPTALGVFVLVVCTFFWALLNSFELILGL
jgi:hypothetical protein